MFVAATSQIASGAWLFTSFNRGIVTPGIMSNFPVTNARILVDTFGMIVYSMPSRYGCPLFQ
jgi:hypothetical protein